MRAEKKKVSAEKKKVLSRKKRDAQDSVDRAIKEFLAKGKITVVPHLKDYSNEPVFVKKAEEAAAFLKEHPLPPEFLKRRKSKEN